LHFAPELRRTGFRVRQQKVTAVDGKAGTESGHDLDFLIERDGIRYGVEVKNQLGYIDQTELQIKLAMCKFFWVRPLFCVRVMPANYFYDVTSNGGYVLVTQNQNYPLLAGRLAERVRATLSLPVKIAGGCKMIRHDLPLDRETWMDLNWGGQPHEMEVSESCPDKVALIV